MKTASQVQIDIINLIKDSTLTQSVSGAVYHEGSRPRDSYLEDITVKFITGLPNQIQTGVVSVLVWVQDIDPYKNGILVKNYSRISEIEKYADEWVESLKTWRTGGYRFKPMQTIYSEKDSETNQHFVVIKLYYEFFENN